MPIRYDTTTNSQVLEVEGRLPSGSLSSQNSAYPVLVGAEVVLSSSTLLTSSYQHMSLDAERYLNVRNKSYDTSTQSDLVFPIVDLASRRVDTPVALISTAHILSQSWLDLGPEIALSGYTRIALWLTIDVNDSRGIQVRCLGKHTAAGTDEYTLPILKPDTSLTGSYFVAAEDEYILFNDNVDQKPVLTWAIENAIPYIQFQASCVTSGSTPGTLATAYVTYAWGQ